jgi:hypothetical protein
LYAVAILSVTRIWRLAPRSESVPWLNYVRFPGAISLLLLLIYLPEITRRPTAQFANSGLSNHPYVGHWLLVTGILFAVSAVTYAIRLAQVARSGRARAGS